MYRYLFAFLLFALLPLCTKAQKTYVLSVGIADYKEINDLRLTENDVAVFNELMAYQNADITTLLGSNATHANIISAMRGTFAKAGPSDTVIFFFSGHGYEGGFCCWDMSGASPTLSGNSVLGEKNRLAQANRYYGGLSYAEIQVLFRNCRAGKKLVFADACFSGGLKKGNKVDVSVQSARNGDIAFFLSSQPNETSLEMARGTNGLFTYYLAEGLAGESDFNKDSNITLEEIFTYVYKNVSSYASKVPGASQHPALWGKCDRNMNIFKLK